MAAMVRCASSIVGQKRLSVHRNGVVASGERLAVPGGPSVHRLEGGRLGKPVVLRERQTIRPDLKAGYEERARSQAPGELLQHTLFGSRIEEDHHVPGRHDKVELGVEMGADDGEISLDPSEFWSLRAGGRKHPRVDIHTNHGKAALRQFDRNPSSSATGVKYACPAGFAK